MVFKNGLLVSFFNVGIKGKNMLIDRIFKILISKFNLKIITVPMNIFIQSPTDILITYLSIKFGVDKIIITLILAFLL